MKQFVGRLLPGRLTRNFSTTTLNPKGIYQQNLPPNAIITPNGVPLVQHKINRFNHHPERVVLVQKNNQLEIQNPEAVSFVQKIQRHRLHNPERVALVQKFPTHENSEPRRGVIILKIYLFSLSHILLGSLEIWIVGQVRNNAIMPPLQGYKHLQVIYAKLLPPFQGGATKSRNPGRHLYRQYNVQRDSPENQTTSLKYLPSLENHDGYYSSVPFFRYRPIYKDTIYCHLIFNLIIYHRPSRLRNLLSTITL